MLLKNNLYVALVQVSTLDYSKGTRRSVLLLFLFPLAITPDTNYVRTTIYIVYIDDNLHLTLLIHLTTTYSFNLLIFNIITGRPLGKTFYIQLKSLYLT